jgi:hypothetical protein
VILSATKVGLPAPIVDCDKNLVTMTLSAPLSGQEALATQKSKKNKK